MKRIVLAMLSILALFAVRCADDEVYKNIPSEITLFLAKYFPGDEVASYTSNDNAYQVVLKNGPTVIFDKSMAWKTVDGNGSTIEREFLFDQLPPEFYVYLQGISSINDVFAVSRTPYDFTVSLLTSKITYNDATGEITSH